MSDFVSWHKALKEYREEKKDFHEDLLRMEGECTAWSKSQNPTERYLATAFKWLAKESRIRETDTFDILELLLGFFESQAKEIDTLRRAVLTLDISDNSLKTEIDNIKTWKERREEILNELEQMEQERRRFLDENR